MERFHIYHACLGLVGVGFGTNAILALASGAVSLPLVVQATFGTLMAGASGYALSRRSPADFDVGPVGFWGVVLGSLALFVLVLS
jgi:hypothetical protein